MSSKNALYESSTLCDFGAEDGPGFGFVLEGGAECTTIGVDGAATGILGLGFGVAVSRLTRTDAGIWLSWRKKTLYQTW